MILFLALSCTGPEVEAPDPDDPGRPWLVQPAEAEDLDPDPGVLHVHLRAARHSFEAGGEQVQGYAYNGQVPGPTLRARVGDVLVVDLDNDLEEPTTIHWHGLKVPFDMDGVTWMQDPVPPGGSFRYTFPLEQAGTFWYHPHFDSDRQVDLGLYGALIVEDPDEPPADVDLVLVMDVWGEHVPHQPVHGDGGGHAHGDPLGAWLVNGQSSPRLALQGGQTARVRVINVSNEGYLDLAWPEPRVIALDQGLLGLPWSPESLVLAPGDRAELEWRVGEEDFALVNRPYSLHGGTALGPEVELLAVQLDHPAPPPDTLPLPFDGSAPTPDPPYTDITWVLQGEGEHWAINGEVFPDITIEELPFGAWAIIEVRNLSATEHPFHLHGLVFELLSVDGEPPPSRWLLDTVNVPIGSRVRLGLWADNPGDWMAHCHILPHAHGMMTVLRVLEPG